MMQVKVSVLCYINCHSYQICLFNYVGNSEEETDEERSIKKLRSDDEGV